MARSHANPMFSYVPAIAGGIVVGGIAIASGGTKLQAGIAALATGVSGYASGALVIQQVSQQNRLLEVENEQLLQVNNHHKQLLGENTELQQLQRKRELIAQEIESLSEEADDLKQRTAQIKQEMPNLEELEARQRDITTLTTQVNERQGELEALKAEIQEREAKQERLKEVTVELTHKENTVKELEEKRQTLHQETVGLEERQREITTLTTQVNERQGELEALKAEIEEREAKQQRLKEVTVELTHKEKIVKELEEKRQTLHQQTLELEIVRNTYDKLKEELNKLEQDQQALKAEVPRLEQERDRILADIQNHGAKVQDVNRLREEISNLEAELRSKKGEFKDLENKQVQLESECLLKEQDLQTKKNKLRDLEQKIKLAKEEIQEIENSSKQALQSLTTDVDIRISKEKKRTGDSEADFLQGFKNYLQAKGLDFPERIVNAFHTSLKVQDISALVILAGISGTGKSELPQAYAEYIGAPLVMLPVQPRWDSPQDLQGFYNYIEKKYKPTELMRYLYQHHHNPQLQGRMVLVLLDEMNLARVEYYFSDFLSKLESRRNKATYLELEVGSLKLNEEQRKVIIPKEFLFVGTMNEDETTQSLSDKVLDRANVLTFGRPEELKLRGEKQQNFSFPPVYLTWETFEKWIKNPTEQDAATQQIKDYVNRANEIMEMLGRPFAHRVYQAITKYVINYPQAEQDEQILKQAVADQFGQKLLPKLRGVMVEDATVREALDKMHSLIAELGDEALNKAFEQARQGQYGQFQWKGMVYNS
ncbi:AAA family ATPase [Spirulina sp. CS-785/01]|uniref:AAA family ATPase n=1 Tax=Spirulina sp. CS-785/01 TaxID=3021716 RepID=UPI00232E6F0E|nr:AAA family ATPase [Spirulina sp. CS-785/01]MDB9312245.1 AAA family ATPase [Spirulina sp. CS-785/01]